MADISLSADVDTSKVSAGMAAIENQVDKTASSIASRFSSLFSAGVLIGQFQKLITAAQEIHSQAERFGIDAEKLQLIANAAKASGGSLQDVARALNILEINGQKALDVTTKQALALEHLGLSANEFAAASPDEKFLMLADAYKQSAQDGQAYADVAELIGKRNTVLIDVLKEGSATIIKHGEAFRIMSNEEINLLELLKVEEDKYVSHLQGVLAKAIVSWGRYFSSLKDLMTGNFQGGKGALATTAATALLPGLGLMAPYLLSGTSFMPGAQPPATPSGQRGVGEAAPVGVTDIFAGGGGFGGGRPSAIEEATLTRTLNLSDRLNELLTQRVALQDKLDVAMAAGDSHAATQYQLQVQLAKIDQQILPLKQQIALEEQRGVNAADQQVQKSANRVELDQLDLQIRDLINNGNQYGAFLLENQRNILQINLDFDEKIQAAIDKANEARAKGLELTAEENELLAQQLEFEKQATLELERQRQEQERQRIAQGPNPLTINALAQNNLRLGATSDVYAAALAASRGLTPGSPEYNRLVQQVEAQDRVRQLQGKNIGFEEQLNRDKLVQWYSNTQQQGASQRAGEAKQQELAYWQAIASGRTAAGNPYLGVFGVPNFTTGLFTAAPTSAGTNQSAIDKLQYQIALLEKAVSALDQIQQNTTLVQI